MIQSQAQKFWIGTAKFLLALLVTLFFYQIASPYFQKTNYYRNSEGQMAFQMPLIVASNDKKITITTDMHLMRLHPNVFRIVPDDCLDELIINGKKVEKDVPFCNLAGRVIDLKDHLTPGVNKVQAVIRDDGGWGKFIVKIAPGDPLFLTLRIAIVLILIGYGAYALRWCKASKNTYITYGVFVACVLLAKWYNSEFLYFQYAYDYDGHLDYIYHVLTHWGIPEAQSGWQMYQPPLYYFLVALWIKIASFLRPYYLLFDDITTLSWLCTSTFLSIVTFLGTVLLKEKKYTKMQPLFLAMIGVTPGVIFFAQRITNDILLHLLSSLFLIILLNWWKSPGMRKILCLSIVLSVSVLAKSTALPLLGVLLLCIACKKHMRISEKLWAWGVVIVVLSITTGWYFVLRFLIEGESSFVGNTNALHIAMRMEDSIRNYLTFNPLKVLEIPYNSAWSDAHRRQFFWEYLFRSVFVGEFDFGSSLRSLVSYVLFIGMALIPFGAYGFFREWRLGSQYFVPLSLFFVAIVGSLLVYRIHVPYGPNQDFRFIVAVIIPGMYFILKGVIHSNEFLRKIGLFLAYSYVTTCLFFLFLLITHFH